MNIIHSITSIDRRFGGPSYTVPRLCEELSKLQQNVEIYSLNPKSKTYSLGCQARFYKQIGPHIFGFSPQMHHSLTKDVSSDHVIHSHGLWQMPSYYSFCAQQKSKCAHIISPRGMLQKDALLRSRFKKMIFAQCWQNSVLKNATCFHAASESEYQSIRDYGLRAPVAIIENGVDFPLSISEKKHNKTKKLLFMSRIHPHKGIDILIETWLSVYQNMPDWELVFCGPGEEPYLSNFTKRIDSLGEKRVKYLPAQYDNDKTELLLATDLFILPSLSENFGIVVAEALAHGIPVITTKGTPWKNINTLKCGWWVDRNSDALASVLQDIQKMNDEDLRAMGLIGRQWISECFSWQSAAEKMVSTYQWLLHGGRTPPHVQLA